LLAFVFAIFAAHAASIDGRPHFARRQVGNRASTAAPTPAPSASARAALRAPNSSPSIHQDAADALVSHASAENRPPRRTASSAQLEKRPRTPVFGSRGSACSVEERGAPL
jgi:hypothetical protein